MSNQFSVATVLPRVPTPPSPTPVAQTGNLFPFLPVTVQGPNLIFSIVHFSPLSSDSPFTFTVSILFSTDDYQYMVQQSIAVTSVLLFLSMDAPLLK